MLKNKIRTLDIKAFFIIFIGTVIVGFFISKTTWAADDLVYMQRFNEISFSWEMLTSSYDDHVVPLFIFSWWVVDFFADGNYLLAAILMILGYVLLQLSCWRLVRLFKLNKFQKYTFLGIFAFSFTIIHNFIWWAAFLSSIVPLILTINYIFHSINYNNFHRSRDLIAAFTYLLAAVFFFEKIAIYIVFTPIFLIFINNNELSFKTIKKEIVRLKYFLIGHLLIVLVAALLYISSGTSNVARKFPDLYSIFVYLRIVWLNYLVPAFFGISNTQQSVPKLINPLSLFSIIVTLILLLYVIRKRPIGVYIGLLFITFFVINETTVALGRLSSRGYLLAGEMRYHLDTYLVFMLCAMSILAYKSKRDSKSESGQSSVIKYLTTFIFIVIFGLNINTSYKDLKGSVAYKTNVFIDIVAKNEVVVVDGNIYYWFMEPSLSSFNQFSDIFDVLDMDIKTTDIGVNAVLPSGRIVTVSELRSYESETVQKERICSNKGEIIIDAGQNQLNQFLLFSIDSNNLKSVTITSQTDKSKQYDFDASNDLNRYLLSTLYLFDREELNIVFTSKKSKKICVYDVLLINRIENK